MQPPRRQPGAPILCESGDRAGRRGLARGPAVRPPGSRAQHIAQLSNDPEVGGRARRSPWRLRRLAGHSRQGLAALEDPQRPRDLPLEDGEPPVRGALGGVAEPELDQRLHGAERLLQLVRRPVVDGFGVPRVLHLLRRPVLSPLLGDHLSHTVEARPAEPPARAHACLHPLDDREAAKRTGGPRGARAGRPVPVTSEGDERALCGLAPHSDSPAPTWGDQLSQLWVQLRA